MDVSAVKTQELLSCFSKLQGAVIIHPCPVCEPRGKRFGIISHAFACHCSWLCRSCQLCYSCLGHGLRMPIWLNWNKTAERIQPLRPFTSQSSTVPAPCKHSCGLSEVAGSSARLWTLPSFPLPVEDLIVLPPAGPAEVKLHSSAPTEHSFGDLWLALAFFYLNNSLALKLLSSALDVTFASRYQFFVCTQHTETLHWDNRTVLKWNCCTRQSVVKQNCVNDWHNDIPSLDNLIWSHVHFSFSNFKQIITLESKILLIPFM